MAVGWKLTVEGRVDCVRVNLVIINRCRVGNMILLVKMKWSKEFDLPRQ